MLVFLYQNKLRMESTAAIVRFLHRQIDSVSCLKSLKNIDDNGNVVYQAPAKSFIDGILDGFPILIKTQRTEFINEHPYFVLAMDGSVSARQDSLTVRDGHSSFRLGSE